MSGEGKLERMEVDYSSTVDEKIPECAQLAKVRNIVPDGTYTIRIYRAKCASHWPPHYRSQSHNCSCFVQPLC